MIGRAISEQAVLIPGGTSGIGLACARAFLAEGARVAIAGRNAERGERAAAKLGPGARFIRADCTRAEEAQAMVEAARAQLGRIDTLVCTIGGSQLPELLFRQSFDDVRRPICEDLLAVLYCNRAVLPVMMDQGAGSIINVASDAGKVATPGETVIGARMAGIIQFTRTLAMEAKRNGIRANVITPSLVEGTPLTERLMVEGTFSAKLFSKARQLAHLGPTTPEDLAALALFLAGPGAARITGQAISVNGGISAA